MLEQRKIVTAAPENSETPLDAVRSWVTPTRLFFVRNHFPVPRLDADSWRLTVEGAVRRRRDWTLWELLDLPEQTVFATVECAGNGRSFLQPHAHGVQWGAARSVTPSGPECPSACCWNKRGWTRAPSKCSSRAPTGAPRAIIPSR